MRRLVVAVIMTLLLGTTAIAYAGVGACKHCYCPELNILFSCCNVALYYGRNILKIKKSVNTPKEYPRRYDKMVKNPLKKNGK